MEKVHKYIEELTTLDKAMQTNVLQTVVVLLLVWVTHRILMGVLNKRELSNNAFHYWRKVIVYTIRVATVLLLGQIWVDAFGSIATFLGLVSAGVAIALKEPLSNLAGWLFIIWRKPFHPGDRIEIAGNKGDVIDIRPFQFTIIEIGNSIDAEMLTGRIIHVPNAKIFTDELVNYTSGFEYIWIELPVLVTFESDWRKAKEGLLAILGEHSQEDTVLAKAELNKMSQEYLMPNTDPEPTVFTSVEDSGVLLTMRFMANARTRRMKEQTLWESTLDFFNAHEDIDFAYPTTRLYNNRAEGKKGTGGTGEP